MALKLSSAQMVQNARAQITEIETVDLIAMLDDPDVFIVDIRDIRELGREGKVPDAVHAPRGMLEFWVDPESKYHREVFAQPGKTYIFFCAAAWRSALATRDLQNMGLAPVAHIEGGFAQWRESGLPVNAPEPKPEKPAK